MFNTKLYRNGKVIFDSIRISIRILKLTYMTILNLTSADYNYLNLISVHIRFNKRR